MVFIQIHYTERFYIRDERDIGLSRDFSVFIYGTMMHLSEWNASIHIFESN